MGWFSQRGTKQDVVDELLADFKTNPKVLDTALRGNQLWVLVHQDNDIFCALYLLEACSPGYWGYKPMDEGMHPYYYNAPKAWAKRVTPPMNQDSANWRARAWPSVNSQTVDDFDRSYGTHAEHFRNKEK